MPAPLRWMLLALGVVAVLAWSDAVHARAGRRRLGSAAADGPTREVVVAFGFRNRSRQANLLNRHRVRVAVRSMDAGGRSRLILSGGTTSEGIPAEAVLMGEYARRLGVDAASIELETRSRTTWENVRFVIPMLEGADRIVFASNPLHAEKARAYLWRQRPDLAERLAPARDHRPGELLLLEPVLAWIGLRNLRRWDSQERMRRAAASPSPSGPAAV